MREFFVRHKVLIICIILAVIFSAVYLYAALYPGYWYNDAFLYKQKDGSFQGTGNHGQYTLSIDDSTVTMTINNVTHIYEVHNNGDAFTILRDGEEMFSGTYHNGFLWNSDGSIASENISMFASGAAYTTEELFPNAGRIHSLSDPQNVGTRGNPWMLALAWFLGAFLIVDILFPDLWFRFRYWGIVEDGYPGVRYRFRQYLGRFLYPIFIVIILFMGFIRT